MKVSILIPYIRPGSLMRCLTAIRGNAGVDLSSFETFTVEDEERIGCPKMLKLMVNEVVFLKKAEAVMFLGDDTIPQKDFLKNAVKAMYRLPDGWGLVGLNDQFHNGNELATHWLAHLKLLPLLDYEFFHTGYRHCFCDNELILRCKDMGRYIWAEDAKIIHDNPMVKGMGPIGEYKKIYSQELVKHDKELFIKRFHSKWQYREEEKDGDLQILQ